MRVREDPRFTPRVIAIHFVAIAGYLLVCALATYAILLLSDRSVLRGQQLLGSLAGYFIVVFGGVALLARYLKKILNPQQKDRDLE